jgi:hypothetical protein
MKMVWFCGRLGGGKTLAAVLLADHLFNNGMTTGTICNFPTDLDLPDWRTNLLRRCSYILDEAHLFVDSRRSMLNDKGYGAMGRKLETIAFFPSVYPIDVRLRALQVQRVNRVSVPGLRMLAEFLCWLPVIGWVVSRTPISWFAYEIWVYRYDLNLQYTESTGSFWIVRPDKYFNRFDTKYIPNGDAGILELFDMTVEDEAAKDVGEGTFYVYEDELTAEEREWLGAKESAASDSVRTLATKIRTSSLVMDTAPGYGSNGWGGDSEA